MEEQPTNAISCMIVDDEMPAHNLLSQYIEKLPWLYSIQGFYRALDALDKIPILNPGILFLDVEMPDLNGLRMLELLKTNSSAVILTTAHGNFAIDGYRYSISGFLLKPIIFDKFLETVLIARNQQIKAAKPADTFPTDNRVIQDDNDYQNQENYQGVLPAFHKNSMWLKVEKRILQMEYTDVTFVEGAKNYVKIYRGDHISYTRMPISEMMRNLPSALFVITNRSFIVNRLQVKEFDGNEIIMKNDFRVRVISAAW
ncbi:LytTR family DNA-binding domain-containing protein [Dyadobacter sp. CY345]|uniref:LytR/AlgR family response regulator transcription factor n=1 Tax=Dyadobacter sp. CY345 TaxID=2909335 RepID=UPI001F3674B2|nr:LytTR family DNA-binding domain-containing protein [Dyadobacter sp. CY345]MCF2443298.1 LytTR family DNA-binding domain-containing protein [Dyadobacter sp. CY345]